MTAFESLKNLNSISSDLRSDYSQKFDTPVAPGQVQLADPGQDNTIEFKEPSSESFLYQFSSDNSALDLSFPEVVPFYGSTNEPLSSDAGIASVTPSLVVATSSAQKSIIAYLVIAVLLVIFFNQLRKLFK